MMCHYVVLELTRFPGHLGVPRVWWSWGVAGDRQHGLSVAGLNHCRGLNTSISGCFEASS